MNKTAMVGRKSMRTRRMWHGVAALTATTALVGGAVLAVAVPSHAQGGEMSRAGTIVAFQNQGNGLCLQDNSSPGNSVGSVIVALCEGTENQSWGRNDGQHTHIGNQNSGRCLQSNSRVGSYGNLHTRRCTGAADQIWTFQAGSGHNGFMIVNKKTGLCVEGDQDGNAYVQVCDSSDSQFWVANPEEVIHPTSSPTVGS
jgi:hypothetical protein